MHCSLSFFFFLLLLLFFNNPLCCFISVLLQIPNYGSKPRVYLRIRAPMHVLMRAAQEVGLHKESLTDKCIQNDPRVFFSIMLHILNIIVILLILVVSSTVFCTVILNSFSFAFFDFLPTLCSMIMALCMMIWSGSSWLFICSSHNVVYALQRRSLKHR